MREAQGNHSPISYLHFISEETEALREERTPPCNAAGIWQGHFKKLGLSSTLTCLQNNMCPPWN